MFVSVHSLSFSSNMYLWAKNDNVLVCLFLATGSLKYDQYHGFFGLSGASMLAAINRQWLCISMNLLCFSCLPFSNSCCCHQFLPSPASNLLSLSLTALTAERNPVIDNFDYHTLPLITLSQSVLQISSYISENKIRPAENFLSRHLSVCLTYFAPRNSRHRWTVFNFRSQFPREQPLVIELTSQIDAKIKYKVARKKNDIGARSR